MLENADFPKPSNNITSKQKKIEIDHWIENESIEISTLNDIVKTSLKFDKEMFAPDKVWIHLDNSKNEYSTRIQKIENGEAYTKVAFATANILNSNSHCLTIIAEDSIGERIMQNIPIKLTDQKINYSNTLLQENLFSQPLRVIIH